MASITKQRIGKYTYLYESISYRDELGRPRNKKKNIGKIDPITGETIYKLEYLNSSGSKESDITEFAQQALDSIKSYGVFWFLQEAANKIGLIKILQQTFPMIWKEIFTLASYLILSDKSMMYCEDWLNENEWLEVRNMSSQRLSELLLEFDESERYNFYRLWCKYIQEQEYIALDITSVSSYSKQNTYCEWGHNRDNENLPQINLCMLFGEVSRLPVFQTNYSGSLGDVSTLESTLSEFRAILDTEEHMLVMDKGFFSAKNVNLLLSKGVKFLIPVSFSTNFAKAQVKSESKDIDHVSNVILTSGSPVRGIYKLRTWNKSGLRLHTHIFFNPEKALKERNALFDHIARLKEIAISEQNNNKYKNDIKRYLIVRKSEKSNNGFTVNIREDVVEKSLATTGWLVLISNHVDDSQKAYDIYRMKDVVEKGFWKYKNSLGLDRLHVHDGERALNKTFLTFIALILSSYVHNVMSDKQLYKHMTFDKLFIILAKQKIVSINGNRFLRPLTKQQKDIFDAFDMSLPTL